MKLILEKQLIDLNEYIKAERTNRFIASKIKKSETEYCAYESMAQLTRYKRKIKLPIDIQFNWYVPNKRKDKDNIIFAKKFILDGLVLAKIIPNDGWNQIGKLQDNVEVDKDNPRIEVVFKINHEK